MEWSKMTKIVTGGEIARARQVAHEADATEPRAASARYDAPGKRLIVELRDGAILQIPVHLLQGVAGGDAQEIAAVEIWGDGYALHWEELDADITVPGLVAGIFGTRKWMNHLSSELQDPGVATLEYKGSRTRKIVTAA
jgi:hypothetical protein